MVSLSILLSILLLVQTMSHVQGKPMKKRSLPDSDSPSSDIPAEIPNIMALGNMADMTEIVEEIAGAMGNLQITWQDCLSKIKTVVESIPGLNLAKEPISLDSQEAPTTKKPKKHKKHPKSSDEQTTE